MGYIRGTPHDQSLLFPEVLDDQITEDNPVRFIDAFVDNLDGDKQACKKGWRQIRS